MDPELEAKIAAKAEQHLGVNLKSIKEDNELSIREMEEYLDAEVDYGPPGPDMVQTKKKLKETFLNMGDPEPFEDGGFEEDDQDDISSLAHGELEQHREWRHYARLAAWEMPLLSKLAKPFEPPTADMPLRFRYTTYMGEQHPAEKKVVLEFSTSDMPDLTPLQREKLKKLVGVRYNPEKDVDPTDTFEDVPLDTRHHHFKPKLRFPKEWLMTDERRDELNRYRQYAEVFDQKRVATGQLVDGVKQIQEAYAARKAITEELPELVMAKGAKPKGKRVAVKRSCSIIMDPIKIAPFEATAIESIPSTVNLCRTTFRSQTTKPIAYRLTQLRKLYWGLVDNTDALLKACTLDLGKPEFETHLSEIDWCKNDIMFITKNLAKWMKDEKAPDIPLTNSLLNPRIRKEPLGTILVIGAYNFPVQLSLGPFIGAIAAGCTGVLKPSEVSPATAMVLKNIVENYLDPNAYAVVNGAIPETTALLNEKCDKIFYTGNATVGTIIAKKAAETLTPVCLELGGRNPAIVTKNADPRIAARRLVWGKLMNAGQVCISQNYIMVEKEILPAFVEQMKIALKEFYPNGQKTSPDFARIVNKRHFLRIKKMVDDSRGKILIGGEMDESENFIEITVVQVKDDQDSMIVDESFGPLIPLLAVDDVEEAIKTANSVHSTPLGLYAFGSKAETNKILDNVTSGGASVNDAFFHGCIPTLAFGGVGDSGQGAYRGKSSFDVFTHRRSVVTTPGWMEKLLDIRYPPFSAAKLKKFRSTSEIKPNFDREGKELRGFGYWVSFLGGLGGESVKGALMRWAIVALIAFGAKRWGDLNGLPAFLK
ncbi:hypothetical protein G7Y89_g1733 [Cudoniella acicularis]|uniref:Beta-apo-4'-carotenal oxygenase n=1 Tax=Cudoniella acicularis TaxID=354080 RepID=A0A8H4W745_9HELO|nr:hypothetical protein G7Y89_g1733 [Cudoniella acicularis]